MKPQDIKTPADVARWLQHHCEWSSKASEDMAIAAIAVLQKETNPMMEVGERFADRIVMRNRKR